jgi:hypothetical protein
MYNIQNLVLFHGTTTYCIYTTVSISGTVLVGGGTFFVDQHWELLQITLCYKVKAYNAWMENFSNFVLHAVLHQLLSGVHFLHTGICRL